MGFSKQDIDGVLAWLRGQVADCTRSVTIVLALDLGFAGTLDSQPQTSCAGPLGVNGEWCWAACKPTLETRAVRADLGR